MARIILIVLAVLLVCSCTPKEAHRELQTFSPVAVDMQKIDAKDYAGLIGTVNARYSPENKEFTEARLIREEGMFIYFQVNSSTSTACYRVTVDRNRSKIINMQPDCAIEE